MKNKNKLLTILSIIALTLFFIIAFLVIRGKTLFLDEYLYDMIPHNEILTIIMKIITTFGSTACLALLAVFLFLIIKDKRKSILFPTNLILIGGTNHLLKFLITRERPINKLIDATGYSFPSGHSASSLAFYGFLIYYINKKVHNKALKFISTAFLSTLILLIGFSRIYLHVHYLTDVLGGFLYSFTYLILFIKMAKKFT